MIDSWLSLPGPAKMLRRVSEDVEEGRSVVIAVPKHVGMRVWSRSFQSTGIARARDFLKTEEVRTAPSPLQVVARLALLRDLHPDHTTVRDLCELVASALQASDDDGTSSGAMRFVIAGPDDWPAWKAWAGFLAEWAQHSRNKPLRSRIVFVVIVVGVPSSTLPAEQDSLRVRVLDAVCDEGDLQTYSHLAFADWNGESIHRRVAAAVAASTAVWDPEVVDVMASLELADILQPQAHLRQLGTGRGWSAGGLKRGQTWEEGHIARVGRRSKQHSAVLALLGQHAAIESRVWSGQVGVLLPFLEEIRHEIIVELGDLLKVPWRTSFADITDRRDLEISHLHEQVLSSRLPLSTALSAALPLLREMRNKLAHLEVVDVKLLTDTRLLSLQNSRG